MSGTAQYSASLSASADATRRLRSKDVGPVPCSLLGVKEVRARGTMGPGSGEELVSTTKFLKAHEREPRLPDPAKPAPKERRKAPLVPRDDKPLMGLSSGRDFLSTNVAEAAAATPKYQDQEEVRYVFKPYFGELPPYLQQRKREQAEQREAAARAAQPQQDEEEGVQVLRGEALEELLRHLKLKWQSLNEAYVRLPCVTDTPSKKRRKEELEAQLTEIERDVRMLSKASVALNMGRDKGGAGNISAKASESSGSQSKPAKNECSLCHKPVAVTEEDHIMGECSKCGKLPFHRTCVQEYLERILRVQIREGGFGTKAWNKIKEKIATRPQALFAQNGRAQRLPQACPACQDGIMEDAEVAKPVRKIATPPPVLPRTRAAPPPAPPAKKPPAAAAAAPPRRPAAQAAPAARPMQRSASYASTGSAGGNHPARPAWLTMCREVLDGGDCYTYRCQHAHSQAELDEREAEWEEEQREVARQKRQLELEAHQRQQEEQAAAAEGAARQRASAAPGAAEEAERRRAALRAEVLAREEAALQLSHDALTLMKRHKREACIASLSEMGFDRAAAAAAADAAGGEPTAAATALMEGGATHGTVPPSVIREARELLSSAAAFNIGPPAVEAAVVSAVGDWEAALRGLEQAAAAARGGSSHGCGAPAPISRQGSSAGPPAFPAQAVAASEAAPCAWGLPPPAANKAATAALGVPSVAAPSDVAAAPPAWGLASGAALAPVTPGHYGAAVAVDNSPLQAATAAWQQPATPPAPAWQQPTPAAAPAWQQPAVSPPAEPAGYADGFAAGLAAAVAAAAPAAAPAADWLPPQMDRPPPPEEEVDELLSMLGIA